MVDATWIAWFRAVKAALGTGGQLYAAAGTPEWAQPPHVANYTAARWAVNALQLTDTNGTRLFAGVMLDVEPHTTWLDSSGYGRPPTQTEMVNWRRMQADVTAEVHQPYCNPAG